MADGAGPAPRSGWRGKADSYLERFSRPGIRVRELMMLSAFMVLAMIVIVVVFFLPIWWIFS
ncbi:hypothetical protein ABIB25_002336 [Nakamurella sp. UYEF19]|uniref:hypothetical protein n=1 Tax=Nakamurella sp. UYEF19 TaxID=1756392 RepID=UPI003393BAF0